MRAYIAMTLIATGLLTGCVPTEKQYDAAVRVLRGSERERNGLLDECIRRLGFSDKKARHNAAVVMNVAEKGRSESCLQPIHESDRFRQHNLSGYARHQKWPLHPEADQDLPGPIG